MRQGRGNLSGWLLRVQPIRIPPAAAAGDFGLGN